MDDDLKEDITVIVEETMSSTIETCATLVEGLSRIERTPFGCHPYAKARLQEAADAIRRLKR